MDWKFSIEIDIDVHFSNISFPWPQNTENLIFTTTCQRQIYIAPLNGQKMEEDVIFCIFFRVKNYENGCGPFSQLPATFKVTTAIFISKK